jgi:hypothetical protein
MTGSSRSGSRGGQSLPVLWKQRGLQVFQGLLGTKGLALAGGGAEAAYAVGAASADAA